MVPLWLIVVIKSLIVLLIVITTFAYAMLFERKILGWMQLRPGPNRVGPWGMLQPAADAVKMFFKEDLDAEERRSDRLSHRAVHLADHRDGDVRDHPVQRKLCGIVGGRQCRCRNSVYLRA